MNIKTLANQGHLRHMIVHVVRRHMMFCAPKHNRRQAAKRSNIYDKNTKTYTVQWMLFVFVSCRAELS